MDYTSYPTYTSAPEQYQPNNQISGSSFYGTASLGGTNGISFGGAGGMNGSQGIWLGGPSPATAPFSVDTKGDIVAKTLKLNGIPVGGAAADVNSHSTTINGSQITGATITNSQIANSTITGSNISGGTITAGNIASGTITSSQIQAGTITATQINASAGITAGQLTVSSLSAITANLGTVTAGTITGVTITGGTIQTATSGQRVVLNSSANQIDFYAAGGSTGSIGSSTVGIINCSAQLNIAGQLNALTTAITGDLTVSHNLTVSGTKAFDIEHPDGTPRKRLRYIAPEGGEVLVICRGKGKVIFPQHFKDVAEPDTIQVIKSGWFWNRIWFATAIRKGFKDFEAEYYGDSPKDHPSEQHNEPS